MTEERVQRNAACVWAIALLLWSGQSSVSRAQELPAPPATVREAAAGMGFAGAQGAQAQGKVDHTASNTVGQFDFYLLDMVPGEEFCRIRDAGPGCVARTGFVVHGLWPQNNNDTWPQFCSKQEAGTDLRANLDLTPDAGLLQHEWDKHGTCTGLSGAGYLAAERRAQAQVTIPQALLTATPNRTFTPLLLLNMFRMANPEMPPGSLSLSCREGRLTAVDACFDKGLQPIACVRLPECEETVISVGAP